MTFDATRNQLESDGASVPTMQIFLPFTNALLTFIFLVPSVV